MEGSHADMDQYNHKRDVEDDIPFHCASKFAEQHDGKWHLKSPSSEISYICTDVQCTQSANASITIGSIPALGSRLYIEYDKILLMNYFRSSASSNRDMEWSAFP